MTMPLTPLLTNELALLEMLVPLAGSRLIEQDSLMGQPFTRRMSRALPDQSSSRASSPGNSTSV